MGTPDSLEQREGRRLAFASGRLRIILELLLMALCGWLYAGIFEEVSFSFLAWFGLLPLFAAGIFYRPKRVLLYAYVWSYAWSLTSFFWLREIMVFIPFVLCLLLAVFPTLWALAVPFLCKNLLYPADVRLKGAEEIREFRQFNPFLEILFCLALASWWCVLEWTKSWLFTGLPWNYLAASQWKNIGVIQICEYTGVYGVSFLIVMINVSVGLALRSMLLPSKERRYRRPYPAMFACALLLLSMTFGAVLLKQRRAEFRDSIPFRAGIVQPNLSQRRNASAEKALEALEVCAGLSKSLFLEGKEKPDVVIWPETAVPYSYNAMSEFSSHYRMEVLSMLLKYQVPFVLGTIFLEQNAVDPAKVDIYNSALLLKPGRGIVGRYSKEHIVPFGEYVPYSETFPWLAKAAGMGRNLTRGKQFNSLELAPDVRAGVLICYEDVYAYVSRNHARNGANVLLVITNDAWYPDSFEPAQHFANSIFRTVETRLPMIRCGNLDYSAVILQNGQVSAALMERDRRPDPSWRGRGSATLAVPVPRDPKPTFYTLYGDVFIGFCGALFLFTLAVAALNWKSYKMLLNAGLKQAETGDTQ